MLNIGIIGYGGMGSYHHQQLIKEEDQVSVTGAFDIKVDRLDLARRNGIKTYHSLDELLRDDTIDAVLIATPNDSHKELAIKAMEQGKPVVCEKPAMMSVKELDEVLDVSKETGKTFMVHQNRRWDSDFLMIRDLYNQKQVGDLFQIETRVHGANGIPGDWRHMKVHGGGMLLDWGVHLLDQILFMVNSPIKEVSCDLSYVLGDEVDDGFIAYLTFENGVRALVEVGTTNFIKLPRWYVKGLEGTGVIYDWDLSNKLVKQTGAIDHHNLVPIKAGQGLTKTMAPPSEEAVTELDFPPVAADFPNFYANFYDVVVNHQEPVVKNEEVRRVLALIETLFDEAGQID